VIGFRLSVSPSVTVRCFVEVNEDTIVYFLSIRQDNHSTFRRGKISENITKDDNYFAAQ